MADDPGLRPDGGDCDDEGLMPRQALARRLRDFLSDAKRQRRPHRANVWERIDRISRELLERSQTSPSARRCSPAHFEAVGEYIRRHHRNDHNLPRRYETVEAYFMEFCPECREHYIDHELLNADDIGELVEDIEIDLDSALEACLERLGRSRRELFDCVSVGFRLGEVVPISLEAYRREKGLSRRQFERLQQQALCWLRQCIHDKIAARGWLWPS